MRVAAYTRVSTKDQEESGLGLEAQRTAIKAEADRKGWKIVEWFSDTATAASLRRPDILRAIAEVADGNADLLVVAKMDRLSRSLLDYAKVIERSRTEGWKVHACDAPFDISTPHGEAAAAMQAVFAQLERRLIGQRTKEALAEKKRQGVRLGRPPIDGDVLARIVALKASGATLRAIAAKLDAEGVAAPSGRPWQPSTLHGVLKRAA